MLPTKHRAIDRIGRNERLSAKLNLLAQDLESGPQSAPAEFDAVLDQEKIDDDLLRSCSVHAIQCADYAL